MDCYLKLMEDKALRRAEVIIGPQAVMAYQLGALPSSLNNYFNRCQPMPVYVARGIELMTKPKGETMKVTFTELIGLLEPREKAAAIVKAIEQVQENKLDSLERPILTEHIYSYRYTGKRSMPFFLQWLACCTFTQALKLSGIKDKKEYYDLKKIRESAIDGVRAAVNKRKLKAWQGALLAGLPIDEQEQLMQLSHSKLLVAIAQLKKNKAEKPSSSHPFLAAIDYLRLLQNDADILPLREELSLYSTLAIHFSYEITLKNRQGQRTDLQKGTKKRQKPAFSDEVNPVIMRVGGDFEEILNFSDEVRIHFQAMYPVSGDIKAFMASHKGRTDEYLAELLGVGKQAYRRLKFIFIHHPELLHEIEAGSISINKAYQQAKANLLPSLITSHEEENQCNSNDSKN